MHIPCDPLSLRLEGLCAREFYRLLSEHLSSHGSELQGAQQTRGGGGRGRDVAAGL